MENHDSQASLNVWKELMDKFDLKLYRQFQSLSKMDLEQMREDWKAMRRFALGRLNKELNNSGKSGQLMNIDVSDDALYPYLPDQEDKHNFFKYSRILDFNDGYKPKDLHIIKKGL